MAKGRLRIYIEKGCNPGDLLRFLGLPGDYPADFKSGINGDERRSVVVPSFHGCGPFNDVEKMKEEAKKYGMSRGVEILKI